MQVSVETIGTLGRRLKVAVSADQVEKEFNARLQRLSKQVKMPGFRPGKVPLKMVEAQYGGRLMDEVVGELIQTTMHEAIGSRGLRPAGDPQVQRKPVTRGEQLEYTVEFEIFPEVKRFDLAGVRIERPAVTVSEEDVNRTLETIRKQRATWKQVDREARLGDRLTIDFVGRINSKEFEGGKANAFQLVLGSGTLIEDIEHGLVGAKSGEMKHVSARFPTDYRHSMLAGQTADFDVKVNDVTEAIFPDLNETFAKDLGVKEGGLDKLRSDVKSNMEREAATRARAVIRTRVLKLLLGEFIRNRGLVPDPARVRARLEEMAADYESPQEFIQWHYAKPERLSEIEGLVMEEKVVEDLLISAQITDKPVSFQDLLKIEILVH